MKCFGRERKIVREKPQVRRQNPCIPAFENYLPWERMCNSSVLIGDDAEKNHLLCVERVLLPIPPIVIADHSRKSFSDGRWRVNLVQGEWIKCGVVIVRVGALLMKQIKAQQQRRD